LQEAVEYRLEVFRANPFSRIGTFDPLAEPIDHDDPGCSRLVNRSAAAIAREPTVDPLSTHRSALPVTVRKPVYEGGGELGFGERMVTR